MFYGHLFLIIAGLLLASCQVSESASLTKQNPADQVFAADIDDNDDITNNPNLSNNTDCPVGLVSGIPLDEEFGAGTSEVTRCLRQQTNIKVVYQINQACKNADCSKPYATGNITNAINDYQITHGLQAGTDYDVVAIVHSKGYPLVLDNSSTNPHPDENPFQEQVQSLLDQGVTVYFCQNTARKNGVMIDQMIPGIQFVTAGVTAIADYQLRGYAMIQP